MGWEGRRGGRGLLAGPLISSSLWYITGGGDLGIFFWWGSQLSFKRGCWTFFVVNYFSQTSTCFSICERQSPIGYPKTIFKISLECSSVTKFNARFIEIISHFKGDVRSCRCNNSSIKQASGLIGGLDPPDPPWIRHCISGHALQCSQYVSIHYTAQQVTRRVSLLYSFGYIRRY